MIDLSSIQTNPDNKDFEIETSDHVFFLQPCKSLSTKCRSPVCMMNKTTAGGAASPTKPTYTSLGVINSVVYGIDKNELILRYVSNVTCVDETFYSTEIRFRCDDQGPIL